MHASDLRDILVNCCEFKIGLVGTIGDNVHSMYFFVILYFVYCHNSEPCTLHSLIVRLLSYLSRSQSPATFIISSAYTPTTPDSLPPNRDTIHRVTVTQFQCQLAFAAILWLKLV